MRLTDFDVYKDLLSERAGLVLHPDHTYILESRLSPIARKWGYSSVEFMTASLHGVPSKDLLYDIVEAMLEKETSFFRDLWPFQSFSEEVLPYMAKNRNGYRRLKIWCAGASTGQEAYSLAIAIKEKASLFNGWKIEILATDFSNEVLEQSKKGIYSQFEVQRNLSVRQLLKYFKNVEGSGWQVNGDLRKLVKHQHFNLLDSMTTLGMFDVIFCRNVLGQFEEGSRVQAFGRICNQLEKDGFLFLGTNEIMDSEHFMPLHEKRGLYVPLDSPHLVRNRDKKPGLAKSAV